MILKSDETISDQYYAALQAEGQRFEPVCFHRIDKGFNAYRLKPFFHLNISYKDALFSPSP